ncbi:MAG: tripartite tricarboxylate transporter substrate binding protein [Alphaproteobacteria bacterium]|nr:tripartite tricarboxylate transporter substrate binding protein [Alphaproteobacteria bacterium]
MVNRAAVSIVTASVFACLIASTPARAADPWPTRPVTVICPFPPGISTDILTRAVAKALGDALGQQFVVENRPGANGNIGAGAAAKAEPDGYTLLTATVGPSVANKFLYKSMSYDPERAFDPITILGSSPLIIVGSPKIAPTNFRELIAYAKGSPGKLNAGTVGPGSQAHITLELINKLAGTSIVHVPYRIATQALPDLISGDLQVGFNYIPTFVPAVQQGTIRGLAVTSAARLSDLPDVPTVDESGFPGFEATGWNALFAPAGTPREIIDKVNGVVNAYLNSDEGRAQLRKMGVTPGGGTPEFLKSHLERERAKWGPIIKDANITLQ